MNSKHRVLYTALALLALTTFTFAQPALVSYYYPGDLACDAHDPLTSDGDCWVGTPIPDGADAIFVFINGVEWNVSYLFNGNAICGYDGFFFMEYYAGGGVAVAGDQTYVEVRYGECTYRSRTYTLAAGANDELLFEDDWVLCDCGAGDPCDTTDAAETGSDGPFDISQDATQTFIDECTMRITAQGGNANDVSVQIFDAVPQSHPVAYDYMSRVVGIFWDGSADPSTTLLVRMYYTPDELYDESGFSGPSCLIAARFDEFAAHWSPVLPEGSGTRYIEFVTDRSGYFTFDCHGSVPRQVQIMTGDVAVSSGDGELVLRWETVDEFENYRFHVLRASNAEGPYTDIGTVNSQLPDIKTTGSYAYEYRDSGLENGQVYHYRLETEDLHGNIRDYPITVSGAPSPYGDEVVIDAYRLHPAYPNPFNPQTRITFDVLEAGHVDLRVFDILGREVAQLVRSEKAQGRHSVMFNATDLPSGLYFYRIDIGGKFTSTQKVLLLK